MNKVHLELAHNYWREIVTPEDVVIDATCGNGHDTAALARMSKLVYALDVQKTAIEKTRARLKSEGLENVVYIEGCHSNFPLIQEPVKLIVYNLGYLPGGDKGITTMETTTLASLAKACELVAPSGMISIMCYPGHEEGAREEGGVMEWVKGLDGWSYKLHAWENRQPRLLILIKSMII